MLFDSTLLFWHTGSVYNFTAGEFVSLVGLTGTGTSASGVINLGNARDLGIGPGAEIPQVALFVGTAVTSSSAGTLINAQFQGSTDSTHWTTYIETGAMSTASYQAGSAFMRIPVPRRAPGAALPLYYQINLVVTGGAAATISTGTILGGIVLAQADSGGTMDQYPSGFSVS